MSDIIIGRNACLEAMRGGRKIHRLTLMKGKGKASEREKEPLAEIKEMAESLGIELGYADRSAMDKLASGRPHQGVIASAEEYSYSSVVDIIAFAQERGEAPFLILLDGIEDPHNLGAIIRSAECAGAHGVIIPRKRSAEVNDTVMKTSAGAAQHMRCARITNMVRTIEDLQKSGVWVYACDMGENCLWDTDMSGSVALVIGNEGRGVSRLVRERCDGIISMPLAGKVGSLNASNAAAIAMYEVVRQRREK